MSAYPMAYGLTTFVNFIHTVRNVINPSRSPSRRCDTEVVPKKRKSIFGGPVGASCLALRMVTTPRFIYVLI